jgi:probable F420-dependent oxidoreductase
MRIGVVFPQTEFGNDPGAIREYAQAAEAIGYRHILAYDHVLGASTRNRPDWSGSYTSDTSFHEPFVLFGFWAAATQRIEFITGVLILPQRQTALVAKQAAEIDILSGGRLRLGIGVGWNEVEFEALNENFQDRGARSEEQIAVLRALWTEPVVDFRGRWHTIPEAGINPLPVQRPIPIWTGGHSERTLRRTARLADGWFPLGGPDDRMRAMIEQLREYAREVERDPAGIGIEARLDIARTEEAAWRSTIEAWRDLGATHACVNTMGAGFGSPAEHIEALRRVAEVLDVTP